MAGLPQGTRVAGYRIESPIARGGIGVVYRATQLALGRQVALKVIAPELAHDDGFRRRFERESRIGAAIDHPNVIPVHEAGEDGGQLFISMRLVSGTDLGRLVREGGALDPGRAAALVAQVGAALDAAHRLGLVHRDVKPANVLVSTDSNGDHAYLTDFGLTKHAISDEELTAAGQFAGTLDYVAPEQLGGGSVDARADVYSLGCILHFCLTGKLPFPHDTAMAKMHAHANEAPPPLRSLRPDLPVALERVVARALAKEPEDRFQSAGDLGRAALAAAAEAPLPEERGSVATGEAASGTTSVLPRSLARDAGVDVPEGAPPPEKVRRRGMIVIATCTAATIVVAAALSVLLRSTSPDQPHDALEGGVSTTSITVPDAPGGIAVGERAVWVTRSAAGSVVRIDPRKGRVKGDPVKVGDDPEAVAAGQGYVWVVSHSDGTLSRVDPGESEVRGQPLDIGQGAGAVAVGVGSVWVADRFDDEIVQVDPGANEVRRRIAVPNGVRGDIAVGQGSVWVANDDSDTITRIDPETGAVAGAPIRAGDRYASSIAVGEGAVWVQEPRAGRLLKIDPKTGIVVARVASGSGRKLAVGGGAVWVLDDAAGTLQRIDPKKGQLVGPPAPVVSRGGGGIAVGENAAWVFSTDGNVVTRVGF